MLLSNNYSGFNDLIEEKFKKLFYIFLNFCTFHQSHYLQIGFEIAQSKSESIIDKSLDILNSVAEKKAKSGDIFQSGFLMYGNECYISLKFLRKDYVNFNSVK